MYKPRYDKYGNQSVRVHEFSVVDENVIFGKNVIVEPFCLIGPGVEILDDAIVPAYSNIRIATTEEIKKREEKRVDKILSECKPKISNKGRN